jgi:hypothetical protein
MKKAHTQNDLFIPGETKVGLPKPRHKKHGTHKKRTHRQMDMFYSKETKVTWRE